MTWITNRKGIIRKRISWKS
jgi:hypothetical protein